MEEKGSGMQRSIALALIQVYAESLTKIEEKEIDKPYYLFIDEPEISLHPQAQRKLLDSLKEISKTKQVFVSTHSPFFVDPSLVDSIFKFTNLASDGATVYRNKNPKLKSGVQEDRSFFLRHRNLFFTNKAIFLEGVADNDRYSEFCLKNDLENLIPNFFIMNGCGPTLFFYDLCKEFGIEFYAIVDHDFAFKYSDWSTKKARNWIERLKKLVTEKTITFDSDAFDKAVEASKTVTPYIDEREVEENEFNNIGFLKVKNKDIFVLKHGELTDYLNSDGTIKDSDQGKFNEILTIFKYIDQKIKIK